MATIAKHTVSVGGSRSHCMNCEANWLGTDTCPRCGTTFVFAASEQMGPDVLGTMRDFAARNGLELIGYSGGGSVMTRDAHILNEDEYALSRG